MALLDVTGTPEIAVPDTVDFGFVYAGTVKSEDLIVANVGSDSLFVTNIITSRPEYSVSHASFVLAPAERDTVTVTLTPVSTGIISGTATVTSNDPGRPEVDVVLTADVQAAPEERAMSLSPISRLSPSTPSKLMLRLPSSRCSGWPFR